MHIKIIFALGADLGTMVYVDGVPLADVVTVSLHHRAGERCKVVVWKNKQPLEVAPGGCCVIRTGAEYFPESLEVIGEKKRPIGEPAANE